MGEQVQVQGVIIVFRTVIVLCVPCVCVVCGWALILSDKFVANISVPARPLGDFSLRRSEWE